MAHLLLMWCLSQPSHRQTPSPLNGARGCPDRFRDAVTASSQRTSLWSSRSMRKASASTHNSSRTPVFSEPNPQGRAANCAARHCTTRRRNFSSRFQTIRPSPNSVFISRAGMDRHSSWTCSERSIFSDGTPARVATTTCSPVRRDRRSALDIALVRRCRFR